MALKTELKELEKNCVDVKDYVELALKALEEPSDPEYAKELLVSAEDECKFPDDYLLVAEVYAKLNDKAKVEELCETAEENAFEPLELGRVAHCVFQFLNDTDKAKEIYQNALKDAKKGQDLGELLSYIQTDFPESDLQKSAISKISSQVKNLEELEKIVKEVLPKNQDLAVQIAKEFEKKIDGIENTANFSKLVFSLFSDKDWTTRLLEEVVDDAKFTKEFVQLAKAFYIIGATEKIAELLDQAKDYAMTGEENYELALAVWELQNDKKSTTELLQKSYKTIKDKNTLASLVKFAKVELENNDIAEEILNFLIENTTSSDELLQNIKFGYEILQNKSQTKEHFKKALDKLAESKDLVTFGTECFNLIGDKEITQRFFDKAFENAVKFEQFTDLGRKYYNLFGADEFIAKVLAKCEEIAKSTTEYIEISNLYFELLKEPESARKNLETAEEIVASLQDMKLVVENVKKFFANDENWVKQVEEKLEKREANQSKYDEFLKLEKDARFLKDYLTLAEKVIDELDDIYYARKLLNKAKELLDNQYLNIENYFKLCKTIILQTKDLQWAKSILDFVYNTRLRFVHQLDQILDFVNLLFEDKELVKTITETYLNGWKQKIKSKYEAIKFAKLLQKYKFANSEIENFLENYFRDEKDFQHLLSLLNIAFEFRMENLKNKVLDEIWNSVSDVNDFLTLVKLLVEKNYNKSELIGKFKEFIGKTRKSNELILLAENYSKLFGTEKIDEIFNLIISKSEKHIELLDKIKTIILEEKYW